VVGDEVSGLVVRVAVPLLVPPVVPDELSLFPGVVEAADTGDVTNEDSLDLVLVVSV